jgi:hypothetical protein
MELQTKKTNLRTLNRAAKVDLSLDPEEVSQAIRQVDYHRRSSAYRKLASITRDAFAEATGLSRRPAWTSGAIGFHTMSILLTHAPESYIDFCSEQDITPTCEQLGESLKRNDQTLVQLLSTPSYPRVHLEGMAGVDTPFSGNKMKFLMRDDSLTYVPASEAFEEYVSNPRVRDDVPEHWQKCPGRKLVLERAWPLMVDMAVIVPELFPYDFKTEL